MKNILSVWNRLKRALGAMPTRPAMGRRTAPGHPGMAALRWGRVIGWWAIYFIAPVLAIVLIVLLLA